MRELKLWKEIFTYSSTSWQHGKIVKEVLRGEIIGEQVLKINTRDVISGIYYVKLISPYGTQTFPISVVR